MLSEQQIEKMHEFQDGQTTLAFQKTEEIIKILEGVDYRTIKKICNNLSKITEDTCVMSSSRVQEFHLVD